MLKNQIKRRCVVCGRLADIEYDVRPYKTDGVCCGSCYKDYVIPAKKREIEIRSRRQRREAR